MRRSSLGCLPGFWARDGMSWRGWQGKKKFFFFEKKKQKTFNH
jgi:hypothetical protein